MANEDKAVIPEAFTNPREWVVVATGDETMSEIPEITADQPEAVEQKPPPRPEMWAVIGVFDGGEWYVLEHLFRTRDEAEEEAGDLCDQSHLRIVRIPGEP